MCRTLNIRQKTNSKTKLILKNLYKTDLKSVNKALLQLEAVWTILKSCRSNREQKIKTYSLVFQSCFMLQHTIK